jgi:uncharacterized UBP type Zn finger protein
MIAMQSRNKKFWAVIVGGGWNGGMNALFAGNFTGLRGSRHDLKLKLAICFGLVCGAVSCQASSYFHLLEFNI